MFPSSSLPSLSSSGGLGVTPVELLVASSTCGIFSPLPSTLFPERNVIGSSFSSASEDGSVFLSLSPGARSGSSLGEGGGDLILLGLGLTISPFLVGCSVLPDLVVIPVSPSTLRPERREMGDTFLFSMWFANSLSCCCIRATSALASALPWKETSSRAEVAG